MYERVMTGKLWRSVQSSLNSLLYLNNRLDLSSKISSSQFINLPITSECRITSMQEAT